MAGPETAKDTSPVLPVLCRSFGNVIRVRNNAFRSVDLNRTLRKLYSVFGKFLLNKAVHLPSDQELIAGPCREFDADGEAVEIDILNSLKLYWRQQLRAKDLILLYIL